MSLGRPLTPEEEFEVQQWQNGRELQQLVQQPGWEIIVNMLKAYSDGAAERLLGTDPGDVDEVRAAHAAAFAAYRIFNLFKQDVERAIEASKTVPDIVRFGAKKFSEVPPESL